MNAGPAIAVLLFAVIMLAVCFLLPVIPAKMAAKKGRSFGAWYVFGFFLWIPAIICAAVIDDRVAAQRHQELLELRHAELVATMRQPQPAPVPAAPQWAPPAGPPAV